MRRDAYVDGSFRYWLLRDWSGRFSDQTLFTPISQPERFGVLWVMLNPSTADAEVDDPTIRKCIGFTKRLGHDSFVVVNLFALRATEPTVLRDQRAKGLDVVGPKNDSFIRNLAPHASLIICAWGAFEGIDLRPRVHTVQHDLLPPWRACRRCSGTMSVPVEGGGKPCPACLEHQGNESASWSLGFTKSGAPRHPLMMPYYAAAELQPWPARAA